MNRQVWIHRAAALASLVLAGIALTSVAAIGGDLVAIDRAGADTGIPRPAASAPAAVPWRPLRPAVRRNGASAKIAIGEYLNGQLGQLGLNITSVETPSVRPLGGGLHLAEVRVQARGDGAASAAAANWVAVNREAIRLKSLAVGVGPDGTGTCTLVLLMVIA
ncbi:MAG: hypothetical protein FD125_2962 [bacterium]|nr:MAG: hypothetical protein FD125_2962 [bacterium]